MLQAGMHKLGPEHGTLLVLTGKGGAAAKAGHNLTIEVGRWQGTIDVGEEITMALTADARSLRVLDGEGGMNSLDDDDKAGISQTIDEEVLKGTLIEFQTTWFAAAGTRLDVTGQLELMRLKKPLEFALNLTEDG